MRRDGKHCETSDHHYDDYDETNKIDEQIKKAARLLPPSWWLRFPREDITPDISPLEKVGKLLIQLHHYYLIINLHQPYLIQLLIQGHGSKASGWVACSEPHIQQASSCFCRARGSCTIHCSSRTPPVAILPAGRRENVF